MHARLRTTCALLAFACLACQGRPAGEALGDAGAAVPAAAPVPRDDSPSDAAIEAAARVLADRPYDLAGDLQKRIDDVHRRFGDRAAVRVESDVFLFADAWRTEGRTCAGAICTGAGGSARFEAAADLARRALPRYFAGRFTRHPDRAVTVLVFSSHATFRGECAKRIGDPACAKPLGFYWPRTREILVDVGPGVETITHEIVHPIMQTDFPSAPAWIDEGIASLFERPVFDGTDGIHGATNWRRTALQNALGTDPTKSLAQIAALFATSDDDFRGLAMDRSYAVARFLCQWLDEKGALWAFYRAWRDGVKDDPDGVKAFTKVVGATPEQAQAEWWRWAKGLRAQAR